MRVLYIIPARAGSKALPGKNIALLGGKPLIAWSVEAALGAKAKGTVLVSTDSKEIAEAAKKAGAEVPFLRPAELATDTAASMDVAFHAMDWYSKKEGKADAVVLLQPTSPLRTAADIDAAMELFREKGGAVVSVCESDHPPLWSNVLPADGSMKGFIRPEARGKSRQQMPTYYRVNGAIYISGWDQLLEHKTFIHDEAFAFIMPAGRSVDIDTETDLKLAELLIRK